MAVSLNHDDIVLQLLELGASLTIQNNKGMTPVMTACSYGHLQSLEQLASKGINTSGETEKESWNLPIVDTLGF